MDRTSIDGLILPFSLPALVAPDRVYLLAEIGTYHFVGVSNMVSRYLDSVDSIDLDFS